MGAKLTVILTCEHSVHSSTLWAKILDLCKHTLDLSQDLLSQEFVKVIKVTLFPALTSLTLWYTYKLFGPNHIFYGSYKE